jgi:hypothetical protein
MQDAEQRSDSTMQEDPTSTCVSDYDRPRAALSRLGRFSEVVGAELG